MPTPTATITENIFHIISFPFETMTEAVVNMSNKILQQFYRDAEWIYGGTLDKTLFGDFGIAPSNLDVASSTPLFARIIQPHWNVTFSLALLLLPATLTLTAVSALRMGATSMLSYADLKESLLGWVIAAGAAAASFYLLGLAHRLSLSAARTILLADFGERVSGMALAQAFFNAAALSAITALWPLPALYVGFFVLFLATSIILGLGLALAAYTALVYMLTAIAPLVITLGVLPPLKWLNALWLKAMTIVFLIPVVDALLLKAAVALYRGFYDPNRGGSLFGFIASLFVIAGVLSALIVVNFKVGEMVFGALTEIHRQAWGATMGVIQMVMTVAGFALGGIGVGAGAGAGAGLATGASSEAAATTAMTTAAAPASGAAGNGAAASGGNSSSIPSGGGSLAGSPLPNGRQSSETASNPGLAQRIAEVAGELSSRISGIKDEATHTKSDPALGAEGVTARLSVDDEDAEGDQDRREQVPDTASSAAAGDNPSSLASDEAGREQLARPQPDSEVRPAPTPSNANAEAQMRRARLAEGFGRVLTLGTRNPLLRSFGTGLQASGALGQYQAGTALDEQRDTEVQATQSERQRQALLDSAMRWSERNLGHAPNDLFDLERDNTSLMAGALHQAFVNQGRATRMEDMLAVTHQTYGQWMAQGRTGGLDAQRDFFETSLDEQSTSSPDKFTEAYQALAERHNFSLGEGFAEAVEAAFANSRNIGSSNLGGGETRRQS
jgi:hypothetical protein